MLNDDKRRDVVVVTQTPNTVLVKSWLLMAGIVDNVKTLMKAARTKTITQISTAGRSVFRWSHTNHMTTAAQIQTMFARIVFT